MHFFKSSTSASKKNQTSSATTTPAQTPRNSVHETRSRMMTQDEALEMILSKSMANAASGPFFNKNKSASAASSPAATPRTSMQGHRASQDKLSQQKALEILMNQSMPNAASGPFVR
ncbi:hypothetical protein BX616_002790 [Lobosporangium transversale]|uniref:Uncharacterized protein n=1 Tax=Lobosporangium transversale TaxID=64571 RepID=A0A1Y2H3Q7_9FUNG|nr:hypothetical protein BCR41DRAFT_417806 [Lobosporangium transversale]KAF9916794.1 hypothetical protein BX616_002790 [Lobosporangium transversale]ORZ28664.1 hypothetical protein BCR41DRAFT_417806 [Lobosporangium transversale]|eukprot:XP_021886337.1 hypothetical protein BCR41DRAFT_417806 [Lobosporangium transversale]